MLISIKADGFTTYIPNCEKQKDGSYRTNTILGCKNTFGRNMSIGLYKWHWEDKYIKTYSILTLDDITKCKFYEQTTDIKECNLLAIQYYMGTDYKVVLKTDDNIFIVEEKNRVKHEANLNFRADDGVNDILKYNGLYHVEKLINKYEGDMATAIELHSDCVYKMYKEIFI
jgi:hypothetical protein